jgi:hypothetical protein
LKTSAAVASLLLILSAFGVRADDCRSTIISYEDRCSPNPNSGLIKVGKCNFEEAKTNFLWASKLDAGAVKTFRSAFDRCDRTDVNTKEDVVTRNFYAAVLAQTHNMQALCSLVNCWGSGELDGYLQSEYLQGHLYGQTQTPTPTEQTQRLCCPLPYVLNNKSGVCESGLFTGDPDIDSKTIAPSPC